jgi:hypothetical protein
MVKNGGVASIFISNGSSVAVTDGACSRDGTTERFYITDRSKSWFDPEKPVVVKKDGTPITPGEIYYAAGAFTVPGYTSGTITVDAYYFQPSWLGGCYGFDISPKADKKDVTVFPDTLNASVAWRKYIPTIKDWTATINRHFWYAYAWAALLTGNAGLVWRWKSPGVAGNSERITYVAGGSFSVARASNLTTVTFVSGTTKASDVKAAVEADATLKNLWELSYPTGGNGSGTITAVSPTYASGGRDYSSDIAMLGKKVLVRFYLDVSTSSQEIISGVGAIEGVPADVKLEDVVESDITVQGDGPLIYHTF